MRILVLFALLLSSIFSFAQDITGNWNGVLDIQGSKLRIVFDISQEGNVYTATMDSPDQGAKGIPTTNTTFEASTIRITATQMSLVYEGKFNEKDQTIKGVFKQGPMAIPLDLGREKIEAEKAGPRPQEPTSKDYDEEEVSFITPNGGHTMVGTLSYPEEFDHVAILISGSGPQNRDGDLGALNHRPFLVLADYLAKNGIAVLRYDDRGVGASGGDRAHATSYNYAEDTKAAAAYLKSRADLTDKKIGLIGHSEGGLIAPIVAVDTNIIDFICLLAGPGINIKDMMLLQADLVLKAEGQSEKMRNINAAILTESYTYLLNNKNESNDKVATQLTEIFNSKIEALSEASLSKIPNHNVFVKSQVMFMSSSWYRYFLAFEPKVYLEKVDCPILAINGSLDTQVPAKENLEGIKNETKNNPKVTIQEIPFQNHLFQICKTGAPSEYGQINETFNEGTIDFIVEWIQALEE